MNTKPFHEHNCPACRYLISTIGYGKQDWYMCGEKGHETLLARRSDDGPDYWSCPEAMIKMPNSRFEDRLVLSEQIIIALYVLSLIPRDEFGDFIHE